MDFNEVVAGVYEEGEWEALEKEAFQTANTLLAYKALAPIIDQLLGAAPTINIVTDALQRHIDEINEALGGSDETAE